MPLKKKKELNVNLYYVFVGVSTLMLKVILLLFGEKNMPLKASLKKKKAKLRACTRMQRSVYEGLKACLW